MWLFVMACTPGDDPEWTGPTGELARVDWTQTVAGETHVEFTADGEVWHRSPTVTAEPGPQAQWLLGVPYGADVDYRVVVEPSPGRSEVVAEGTVSAPELPPGVPLPEILVDDPTGYDPAQQWFVTSMNEPGESRRGHWWVHVFDRQGNVVWALRTPDEWVSRHVSVAADGRALLVDRNQYWTDAPVQDGAVARMRLDGEVEHLYPTPGLHHAFVELPDGSIAWGERRGRREVIATVDEDGIQTDVWACDELVEKIDDANIRTRPCGTNALSYDARRDRFVYSFWSYHTVAEVARESGEMVGYYGKIPGGYEFAPTDSRFIWQHDVHYLPSGNLLVSTRDAPSGDETWVREYEIDHDDRRLREVWRFGEGRGIHAQYMGEAHRLDNGNTLHVVGSAGHAVEVTAEGDVVWEADWPEYPGLAELHNGRTTLVSDLYALVGPPRAIEQR